MKKTRKNSIIITVSLLLAFVIWTLLVKIVDVEAIGPNNTKVGFATLNGAFHTFTGAGTSLPPPGETGGQSIQPTEAIQAV